MFLPTERAQTRTMSKIAKGIVYGGGIIAFGYALLKYTVPSEEEMQKVKRETGAVMTSRRTQ